jgi:hypothetical protein
MNDLRTRVRPRLAVIGALVAVGALAACATSGQPPVAARPQPATEPAPAAAAPAALICTARVGADRLRRSALVRTLDAGLGRWLQTVSVDPMLDHGHFRGWIVRALPAGDACYQSLDLRENDLVTRVNGRSIERPEEAHAVWDSLRTSSELVVDFVREDQPHTLRFTIVDP